MCHGLDRRTFIALSGAIAATGWPALAAEKLGREFWLVRHGESVINLPNGIHSEPGDDGSDDGVKYPLTLKGMLQAQSVAKMFSGVAPAAIFASTRLRTIQTADAIAFASHCMVQPEPALAEISFGRADPAHPAPAELSVMSLLKRWLVDNEVDVRAPGGESCSEARARALPFFRKSLEAQGPGQNPVVYVSHGALIAVVAPVLFSNISGEFAYEHLLTNTAVVKGVWEGGGARCLEWAGEPLGELAKDATR